MGPVGEVTMISPGGEAVQSGLCEVAET